MTHRTYLLAVLLTFAAPCRLWAAGCGLGAELVEAAGACERRELGPVACAWLPILENLAAERTPQAIEGVGRAFDLPAHRARGLVAVLTMLMVFLVDCPPARVAAPMLDPEVNRRLVASRDAQLLVELLFPGASSLRRLEREYPDPAIFARAERAGRGLVELFQTTGLRQAMAALTADGSLLRPGATSRLSTWSGGLEAYAPLLRQVDGLLKLDDSATRRHQIQQLGLRARDSVGRPHAAAVVFARAGFSLALVGRSEEALDGLRRAEVALEGVAAPRWRALQQLTRLGQILVYRSLAQEVESVGVEHRLREAGSQSIWQELLKASKDGAPSFSSLLTQAATVVAGRRFLESQPIVEAMELLSPEVPGTLPEQLRDTWKAQERIQELAAAGRLEDALATLNQEIERRSSYLLAGPAGVVALKAQKVGALDIALEAADRAVEVMEQELASQRLGGVTRRFMEASGMKPFLAATVLAQATGQPQLAFTYAERGRAFSTRRLLGSPARLGESSAAERALAALLADLEQEGQAGGIEALYGELELARLERQLAAGGGEEAMAPLGVASLEAVQASLQSRETVLAFLVSGTKLMAWRIDRDSFMGVTGPWRPDVLECQLADLRWRSTPPAVRRAAASRGVEVLGNCRTSGSDAADELAAQILGRLLDGVPPDQRLVLVPHGPLHRLPWAAIRSPSGRRLVEDYELMILPSATTLGSLRSRPRLSPGRGAVILGDPLTHLAGLDFAAREARVLGDLLGADVFIGAEATEAVVRRQAPGAAVLHLAVHGVYSPRRPLLSRLQLAQGGGHDGALHVHEIWDRFDLRRCRLAVLSACETAAGEPTAGDDVVGLTQAFLVAGCSAVISTLWPVDDEASALLMTAFYEHWRSGAAASTALRQAQLHVRARERYRAPYFWAGFTLTGDGATSFDP